ncbi:MAG: hypothetical protein RL660_1553 [Bacteroidota bacterium]|jgi:antitoxin component YwqK of YwqJK toxin-antitoxin module
MAKTFGLLLLGLLQLVVTSCNDNQTTKNKLSDKINETVIANFSKYIFESEVINSKLILDSLKSLSDNIFVDTAKYLRTPKARVFANTNANTHFRVFEQPRGVITAISFYKKNIEINSAEYYNNGQVMCKFNTTTEGVRDGNYYCYEENGKYRMTGYYKKGVEVKDSARNFEDQ